MNIPVKFKQGILIGSFATDPDGYDEGQIYWNTTYKTFRQSNGIVWADLGETPTNANAFTGALALNNRAGTYYDPYDLSVSGTITFSVASGDVFFSFAYLPIISDGVTAFASEANLNAIFNEQYNLPTDRILPEGLHIFYIIKTPTGVAINAPENQFIPDITAPTVLSATIESASPNQLVVVLSEAVNITNVTGLTLDGGLSAIGITSIVSGDGTAILTLGLDADASAGDAGNFVYGVTNTIEDLSGNGLIAGSTSVTNNIIVTALDFDLVGIVKDATLNEYEATSGGSSNNYAKSQISFSGSFIYQVEVDDIISAGVMIGLKTSSVNGAWNDATNGWLMGCFNQASVDGTSLRVILNSAVSTNYAGVFVFASGDLLKLQRNASNIVTILYNSTIIHTFASPLTGDLYLNFAQSGGLGNKIINPTKI